jgi:prepilin-type N-terminal cleavage/methylation domain-containing protein/prepilin-type processing-associated H-X9-DG protein
MPRARHGRPAFTLIELLVTIAIIGLLIAILLPSLASARSQARATACGARLQQLGIAAALYLNDYNNALPQAKGPVPEGGDAIVGALFGGKRGQLPMFNIDQYGAQRRPLSSYVFQGDIPPDSDQETFELEAFRSPADRGAEELYLPLPEYSHPDSIYDLLGTSYAINDHGLDGDYQSTLIPRQGGKMPFIQDPTKTWMIGSHTIYNFQQDSDRGQRWYHPKFAQANLLFVDGHVRIRVPVPDEWCVVENTTPDYTFFPTPRWGN